VSFKAEVSVGDLLTFAGLLVASIGLFLTLASMRRANRQKRAEFIIGLQSSLFSDPDMMAIYYEIEYGQFAYDGTFHGSLKERQLDKLLGLFENIAKLWAMGNLKLDDVRLIAYEYVVVYQDPEVSSYIAFLDEWFDRRGMRIRPFDAFRSLGTVLVKRFSS